MHPQQPGEQHAVPSNDAHQWESCVGGIGNPHAFEGYDSILSGISPKELETRITER
jgi:hypothetical protein